MSKAEKLYLRMQNSYNGWGQDDLDALYCGFGFECKEGKRHRLYSHPDYPQLVTTVARHNDLALGYITTAVRLIKELKKLQEGE